MFRTLSLILNPKKNLCLLTLGLLTVLMFTSFIVFIANQAPKELVIILEDCEFLLTNRDSIMPAILNVSDGILSSALKLHFILTCNCPISDIDPALTRKGRLLHTVEFQPLAKAHAQSLVNKLSQDHKIEPFQVESSMTLAEIFHHHRENGYRQRRRVGFK